MDDSYNMENYRKANPVFSIRDENKNSIVVEMMKEGRSYRLFDETTKTWKRDCRIDKNQIEFSYFEEDEEGWGSGAREYVSIADLHNMAEGLRTIIRGERDFFQYSCYEDVFKVAVSYNAVEDRYTFSAGLLETLEREYHITVKEENLTFEKLMPLIHPFFVWETWFPVCKSEKAVPEQ